MGNINKIITEGGSYSLGQNYSTLENRIAQLQSDIVRLQDDFRALDISIPIDQVLSKISNNAVSNSTVASSIEDSNVRINQLDQKLQRLNLANYATKDYVLSNINEKQLVVKNEVSQYSNDPVSSAAVASEIRDLKQQIAELKSLLTSTYVTKDYLNESAIGVDGKLSETSTKPVSNRVITKKFSQLTTLLEDCEEKASASGAVIDFTNNTLSINGKEVLEFTQLKNGFKISVLGGQKVYTINTTTQETPTNLEYDDNTGNTRLSLNANSNLNYVNGTNQLIIS